MVLFAYDGSDPAKSAIREAARRLRSGRRGIVLTVWQRIVTCATDHDAELVVMGSHGRSGIGLVLMGSVAAAVSRHTERPVLIVHAPA
jgi:nucleotide-binding universal stress UspA family protein